MLLQVVNYDYPRLVVKSPIHLYWHYNPNIIMYIQSFRIHTPEKIFFTL